MKKIGIYKMNQQSLNSVQLLTLSNPSQNKMLTDLNVNRCYGHNIQDLRSMYIGLPQPKAKKDK